MDFRKQEKPKKSNIGKIPPQNLETEQSFLGCLLIDKDSIIKVADIVTKDDFYKTSHSLIYDTMRELFSKQEPIDILSLANRLEEKEELEKIGGRTYLTQLSNFTATSSHIVHYANIIQKKATLRRLLSAASDITELGYNEEEEIDKVLDTAEKALFSVSQKHLKTAFSPINQLLTNAFERLDDLHKQGGAMRGTPTGFVDLDNKLSGLQKSDLIILAARPSVGKTSFVLDVARQSAVKHKAAIGVFSLEMSKEQLVDRMLCAQANVSLWRMRSGKLDESNDFAKIGEAMGQLSEAKIYIDDSPSCSVMEIRTKCRRLKMEQGLDVIIIDYLQLMEGRGSKSDNRVQEVAEISRGLKGIARELDVPVIALSQLSRAVESTCPAIPKLSHLRDSGSIEQDADIVMFLYRKAADRNFKVEDLAPEDLNSAELYVAKHRNGPTGKIDLFFDSEQASYKSMDRTGIEPN